MRTTAIMNLKGGTAKTVTAINIAAIIARIYDKRVLLVDADSQANLTEFTAPQLVHDNVVIGGFSDLLRGLDAFPMPTTIEGVKILFADNGLMDLDVTAATKGLANPMALADFVGTVEGDFDWCIIDCPPAFSAGAMAALAAADEVIIPMKVDAFGIRGVQNLLDQVRNMRRVNPDLEVAGILPTMTYPDPLQIQQEEKLRTSLAALGIRTFHHIRRSVLVDRSTFSQEPLLTCSPRSKTLYDYKVFLRQLAGDPEGGEL